MKNLALLLTVTSIISANPAVAVFAESTATSIAALNQSTDQSMDQSNIIASGSCGESATYILDSTGTLTIRGTGEICEDGYLTYFYNTTVKKIVIGEGITKIGTAVFANFYHLTEVSLPSTLTEIGEKAFAGTDDLKEITIPGNVKTIGASAFEQGIYGDWNTISLEEGKDSYGLKKIVLQEGVKTIGEKAFLGCVFDTFELPKSVSSIGNNAIGYVNYTWKDYDYTSATTKRVFQGAVFCYKGSYGEEYMKNVLDEEPFEVLYQETGHIVYLDHNENDLIKKVTKKATAKKEGVITYYCKECGRKVYTEKIFHVYGYQIPDVTYTGKACKPEVSMCGIFFKTIDKSNYTVSYSNNKKVGIATANIKFKGDYYTGTVKKTFRIKPKNTKITGIKVKGKQVKIAWKKQPKETSGYQIQLATNKGFHENKVAITVKSPKTTSTTVKLKSNSKKYYVRIRTYKDIKINGKQERITSKWTKAQVVK